MRERRTARPTIKPMIESVISGASLVLAVVTVFWREWIEFLFGFDPDHGNGSAEWSIVLALAVIGIALGVVARREWAARKAYAVERA